MVGFLLVSLFFSPSLKRIPQKTHARKFIYCLGPRPLVLPPFPPMVLVPPPPPLSGVGLVLGRLGIARGPDAGDVLIGCWGDTIESGG